MRAVFPFVDRGRGRPLALLGILVVATGCFIGKSIGGYAPAHSVRGTGVDLEVDRPEGGGPIPLRGELLLVGAQGLLVLAGTGQVVEVPYADIRSARFVEAPDLRFSGNRPPSDGLRRRLALFARYPYGLDEAVLASLLARTGQAAAAVADAPGIEPGMAAELRVIGAGEVTLLVRGELLAVEGAGLLLRTDQRAIVLAPYRCIAEARFGEFRVGLGVGRRMVPDAATRRSLARRARFPDGVSDEDVARLLPANAAGPTVVECEPPR